ncbi:hypothetical protein [Streptantibioticus cattleyicolor]|uniref:Transmembrane protein n=1 Tax=Streptantibioticus cattleyicolor (strain ATCC 35852 / DSM 46488 / JCM 4925 / NBRC 14057 / NRRL 8057) TaxID=1003195 RepID=F8JJ09_STREN|nr:hypothetical protein [Streptantibioticus cattleyicolor]AEW98898.1 hypothetical protein SCATT_p07050 [Streptantibioticus cattleyicolor NRRL 8057 = DSM 46488]CCB72055.1 putative membrane protein [Streptantibioticus cattleyicolor NRRL 8057 = DSM 46488]
MNTTAAAVTGAVAFVWLGMVLGISFLEAPLKFRAPGVTVPIGLGIGRLVFRALNAVEAVLAVAVVVAVVAGSAGVPVVACAVAAAVLLAVQLAVIRPPLNRRSDRVLAGEELPRSSGHLYYVACESLKVAALVGLGVSALVR